MGEKSEVLTRARLCLGVVWAIVLYLQIYLLFKPNPLLCTQELGFVSTNLLDESAPLPLMEMNPEPKDLYLEEGREDMLPPSEEQSSYTEGEIGLVPHGAEGRRHYLAEPPLTRRKVIGVYSIFIAVYKHFLDGFISNIREHFVPSYDKVFLIITDDPDVCRRLTQQPGFQCVVKQKIGWPYETLNRWAYFKDFDTTGIDYVWFFNSNAHCVETITEEVISPFTAVIHDNYVNKPYELNSFERRPVSHAFVPNKPRYIYYGARLLGASTDNFLRMCDVLERHTRLDELSKFIAMWHDESHYNHYINVMLDQKVKVIGTEYHVPEDKGPEYIPERKIIYLDKKAHIPNLNTTKSSRWQDWLGGHPHVHTYFKVPDFRPHLYRQLNEKFVTEGMSEEAMIKDFLANFKERRYYHETEVFAATFDASRYAEYYGLASDLEAKADYYGSGYWDDRYYFVKAGAEDYAVEAPTMVMAWEPDPEGPFKGEFVPH